MAFNLRLHRLLLFGLAVLVAACGRAAPATTLPPATNRPLRLYSSPTPSQTGLPATLELSTPTLPITPPPSATPFTHTIVKGDTMGSIALKYGVSLEELLATNPETDPHFLTVGKTVIIPLKVDGQDPAAMLTPTPVPVGNNPPQCYQTAEGGVWCFLEVTNERDQALENITAWIGLFTRAGELVDSQVALAPLNLLPPGKSMPLVARFPPPAPAGFSVRAELQTALQVSGEAVRYLPAQIEIKEQELAADGRQAKVRGRVTQPVGTPPAGIVWVAAVAYSQEGDVIGVRRWEADSPCPGYELPGTPAATVPPPGDAITSTAAVAPLPQGNAVECMPFEISVFSLGPPIDRVEVLVEARP